MTNVISQTTQKARKAHRCNYCRMPIEIGQEYIRQYNEFDGDTYTWKMHTDCDHIAQKLINFKECDDGGASSDDFYWSVVYKYEEITGLPSQGKSLAEMLDVIRKELSI